MPNNQLSRTSDAWHRVEQRIGMSAFEETYRGVEAQRIYYDFRERTAAFNLIREVVPLTYALHAGPDAGRLISNTLARLEASTGVEEVHAVFMDCRRKWDDANFTARLTADKEGAWHRSLLVAGLDRAIGHLIDMGNHNNGFGDYLLRVNPDVEHVTGVDHRNDPNVLTSERLDFVLQDGMTKVPLENDSADTVAFRVALHHWTKPVQEALLAEAARIVRPGGEILIVEDSWANRAGLTDNALTQKYRELSDEDKVAALALIDVSSCLMKEETVAYPMSYRSAAEWESMLAGLGATSIDSTYWGFTMFTVYGAPMIVIRASMS
jgi:SAM-dependent methyltransferase